MNNTLNREGIENYSQRVSQKTLEEFFVAKEYIDGEEIKNLTQIEQVNFFVIKELFFTWKNESQKLKSPYFNYHAEQVKLAMDKLMNVLSKNIQIQKNDLEPLLTKAINDSILLIFSPFDYYVQLAERHSQSLTIVLLKEVLKYLRVNKSIMEKLIQEIDKQDSSLNLDQYRILLNYILQETQFQPENTDVYFDIFNSIEPLSDKDIYEENPSECFGEDIKADQAQEDDEFSFQRKETFYGSDDALYFEKNNNPANSKNFNLKSKLSLNQLFMFQNTLFDGEESKMNQTLAYIDQCESRQEAMNYLDNNFPHWDTSMEEYEEFYEIISNKWV